MKINILLFSLLLFQVNNLQCGEENIEHCNECGNQEKLDFCKKCDDYFFPVLGNLICLPCNNDITGHSGCNGKCNLNGTVYTCEDGCKEGYYNLSNNCNECSNYRAFCEKCTYNPPYDYSYTYYTYFNCTQCESSKSKLVNGRCNECFMSNCDQCHYEGENSICDKCNSGYYLKNNTCIQCNWIVETEGKACEVCSDDLKDNSVKSCNCTTQYTESDSKQCIKCPDNCFSCSNKNGNLKCLSCDEGYGLNSKGICVTCGDNCDYCYFDNNDNPICLYCKSNSKPKEDKNCLTCPNNCESCIKGKDNINECTKCKTYYGLLPNKTCQACPSGCKTCFWNEEKGEFDCSSCNNNNYKLDENDKCIRTYIINEKCSSGCSDCYYDKSSPDNNKYKCNKCTNNNYVYINNEYKCYSNTNSSQEYFYGCINATFNSVTNLYECLKCAYGYIYIIEEKKCLPYGKINLSYYCEKAKNIGTIDQPVYSCINCSSDQYVQVDDSSKNIMDCDFAYNYFGTYLVNCKTAQKSNGNKICNSCNYGLKIYYNETYNTNMCPDSCEKDSFLKYKYCRKCDDPVFGNPGCLPESGFNYDGYDDKLNCEQCKDGYFLSSQVCSPCSLKNIGCKKCTNSSIYNFKCEECFDGYILNNTNSLCELVKYQEYSEVSLGCLVYKDKLDEYKANSKCQTCKEGFFKTKDGTCEFCKLNSNGGHGCGLCDYDSDNNNKIICAYCPEGGVLNSEKKCLNCSEEFGEGCLSCKYVVEDEKNNNKLVCTKCSSDYYLTSNGYCVYLRNYFEEIPNCISYYNQISSSSSGSINIKVSFSINYYNIKEQKFEINTYCNKCNPGYSLKDGKCIEFSIDNCTLSSIVSDDSLNSICEDFCFYTNAYTKIYYYIDKENIITNINSDNTISVIKEKEKKNLYYINYYLKIGNYKKGDVLKSLNMSAYMCLGNLGTGDKNNPINLRKCAEAIYNKIDNTYECIKCLSGYILDNETKTCIQETILIMKEHPGLNCYIENIGQNPEQPIYSCKECYDNYYILATTESEAKICLYYYNVYGCTDVNVDTTYIEDKYECTNCSMNYILYESKFYQSKICENIYSTIKRVHNFNLSEFSEREKESVPAKNGVCESNKLFTPDGINCFSCNSENVGMPGCKGSCTFSMKRYNYLECEENSCKSGYIETSKGICVSCSDANNGCIECHYDNDYPENYKGLKRKRRFVCDQCKDGYIVSADSTCHRCSSLGLDGCERCKWDENQDNELVCTECYEGYFFNENNKCTKCYNNQVRVNGNKCASCNEKEYGGIEGCSMCKSDNNKIIKCYKCDKGFMLYEKNNTCLRIANNTELQKIPNCIRLDDDSDKLTCTLCEIYSYTKISRYSEEKCVPSDVIPTHNIEYNKYCEKFVNLNQNGKELYSCFKCIDNEYLEDEYFKLTKFIFESNRTEYCDLNYKYSLGDCKEAHISEDEDGKIKKSCWECYEGSLKYRDDEKNSFYCKYKSDSTCEINFCKKCKEDNNNICETCYQNYEINSITGFCVKKTEKIPFITWIDIFGLKMNQQKELYGKILYGPSLTLRGLTNSQINEGHGFSFNISFEIKDLIRNLEEEEKNIKEVPMICKINQGVDESEDEPNVVDYGCIGNLTSYESAQLTIDNVNAVKIVDDRIKNEGILMPSNLNDMGFSNIKENKSHYSIQKALKTSMFTPDEIKNQTSYSYEFDFTLKGKINGNANKTNLGVNIPLSEIDENAKCNLNIEADKSADLSCYINLEQYSNLNTFSFKVAEYENNERTIILSQLNEIFLIHLTDEKENGAGNKKTLYILIGGGGGVLIGIIITVILLIQKKKKMPLVPNVFPQQNLMGINPIKMTQKINDKMSIKKPSKNKNKIIKGTKSFKKSNKSKDKKDKDSSKRKIIPFANKNN